MSGHTKAPWFVVPQNNAGTLGTSVWALGGDVRIADCNSGGVSLEGRRADARLIAAAPDLLEALKYALVALESGNGDAVLTAQEDARAAIQKAEGR